MMRLGRPSAADFSLLHRFMTNIYRQSQIPRAEAQNRRVCNPSIHQSINPVFRHSTTPSLHHSTAPSIHQSTNPSIH
jgi:hypothetical protein